MAARREYEVHSLGASREVVALNLKWMAEKLGFLFVSMAWHPEERQFLGVFEREVEGG